MRLFVPACGDRIRLTADWSFTLYLERRNTRFAEVLGLYSPEKEYKGATYKSYWGAYDSNHKLITVSHTLPEGTVLECDRVYIKGYCKGYDQDTDSFDSITWKVIKDGKMARNQRFWTKLSDAHNIEYEVDSLYRDRERAK